MPSLRPFFFIAMLCIPGFMFAQVDFPQPSPLCKYQQKVGLTDVSIEYSRPGMKGRTIFGDLLPYGKMWRTGANASTKVEFSKDVTIMGNALPAGKYALYTIPGEKEWTVVFHKNTSHWGVGGDQYDPAEDAFRVQITPELIYPKRESLSIEVNSIRVDSATIDILWEATLVSIPVNFGTSAELQKKIEQTLEGPGWRFYYSSAIFYRESGKDLEQSLTWMDKAMEMREPTFWMMRQKSLIQADMGRLEEAVMTAKKSLTMAEEAGNDDYVSMNKKSIEEWSAQLMKK